MDRLEELQEKFSGYSKMGAVSKVAKDCNKVDVINYKVEKKSPHTVEPIKDKEPKQKSSILGFNPIKRYPNNPNSTEMNSYCRVSDNGYTISKYKVGEAFKYMALFKDNLLTTKVSYQECVIYCEEHYSRNK